MTARGTTAAPMITHMAQMETVFQACPTFPIAATFTPVGVKEHPTVEIVSVTTNKMSSH